MIVPRSQFEHRLTLVGVLGDIPKGPVEQKGTVAYFSP